jgi:hypothetical protein
MKRNAARECRGIVTVSWCPTPDLEWLVDVDFVIYPEQPENRDEPGVPAEIEMIANRVYQRVEQPALDGTQRVIEITGGCNTFGWLLELDEAFHDQVARECSEHAAGADDAAMEAHFDAQRERRAGL